MLVGLPEIIALGEDLVVVLLLVLGPAARRILLAGRLEGEFLPPAPFDRVADRRPPLVQFLVVQEVLDDQESLFRVAFPLAFRDLGQHRLIASLSFQS